MGNSQTFGIGTTSRKRATSRSSTTHNGRNRGNAINDRRAGALAIDVPSNTQPPPLRAHTPSSPRVQLAEEVAIPERPVQRRHPHPDVDPMRLAETATPMGRRMRLVPEIPMGPVVKPAQPEDIMALPTHRIMNARHLGDQTRCAICFEDFEGGDCLKTMPCMHFYHSTCISRWLGTSNACPVCKTSAGAASSSSSSARQGYMPPHHQQWPHLHLDDPEHAYEIAEEMHLTQSARIRGPMSTNCRHTLPERCICRSGRSCYCNADQFQHDCICTTGISSKCRAHIAHDCICDAGMSNGCRALPLTHVCICHAGLPSKCKANEHPCLCGQGLNSRCRAGPLSHVCICTVGTPSSCRGRRHPCICETGMTSQCRAEGHLHLCVCHTGAPCRCRGGLRAV